MLIPVLRRGGNLISAFLSNPVFQSQIPGMLHLNLFSFLLACLLYPYNGIIYYVGDISILEKVIWQVSVVIDFFGFPHILPVHCPLLDVTYSGIAMTVKNDLVCALQLVIENHLGTIQNL